MLKIGIVSPANSGKLYHRFQIPFNLIEDFNTTIFDGLTIENPATNYDVIIINGAFMQPLELLIEAKKQGVKIVWDCDDYIQLPVWHDNYCPYQNLIYSKQQLDLFKIADIVWVASKQLLKLFKSNRTYFIPNAIHYTQEQWRQPKTNDFDMVWTGGSTHYLHLIKSAAQMPKSRKALLGGYVKENEQVWQQIMNAFNGNAIAFPAMEAYQYGQIYSHGKVAIAPLEDNRFNQHRSVLKALEAAAYNLPFASDNLTTYADVPMPKKDYRGQLKLLCQSQSAREEWGSRVREWADKNFNIHTINQLRYETIKL
jgi:hypothetical protein